MSSTIYIEREIVTPSRSPQWSPRKPSKENQIFIIFKKTTTVDDVISLMWKKVVQQGFSH